MPRRSPISPNFLACVAVAAGGGFLAWSAENANVGNVGVFLMVIGLWIVTVCLHEFGHALTAYRGGDHAVEGAGYLTLDPLKYTHPVLSILLPLVFIALGGIGLPGGAVLVNHGRIRTKLGQSLVSAAGPFANLALAVVTLAVVRTGVDSGEHGRFWAGLSFFALLQVAVLLLNLLPIPGLDGYGIIEPWLSPQTQQALNNVKQWGIFIAIGLLWVPEINQVFFDAAYYLFELSGTDRFVAAAGQSLFQFWESA